MRMFRIMMAAVAITVAAASGLVAATPAGAQDDLCDHISWKMRTIYFIDRYFVGDFAAEIMDAGIAFEQLNC